MNPAFGPGAARHMGLAARALGWRPAEFWAATPAELVACLAPAAKGSDATLDRADLTRMINTDMEGGGDE